MKVIINKNLYGYSIVIKNEDIKTKEEIKSYMPIRFAKCEPPVANSCRIKIEESMITNFKRKNGEISNEILVFKYEILNEYDKNKTTNEDPDYIAINDSETLPF